LVLEKKNFKQNMVAYSLIYWGDLAQTGRTGTAGCRIIFGERSFEVKDLGGKDKKRNG
jgi:hypothetical protein